jgi:hypothetical protein
MYMVVNLHILGQGGVLHNADGADSAAAWLLEISAYCAVDCYAIISGYVSYSDEPKPYHYRKFLGFWVQVFTYSFGITLVAFLLKQGAVGVKELVESFIPIATKQYWYASAYAGLFFVIPWINKLLRGCNRQEVSRLAFALIAIYIVYVTFANRFGDCFSLDAGYSFGWLTILYIVGAWMKKCDVPAYLNNRECLMGIIFCVLFTWVIKMFIPANITNNIFINYTSFSIVFIALALVVMFSKLHMGLIAERIVNCFAPAAFGVYLIHTHRLVWNYFMKEAFIWITNSSWWLLVIEVLISAFCIFIFCLLIEKIRLILFRILKIDELIKKIAIWIECSVDKIYSKIFRMEGQKNG